MYRKAPKKRTKLEDKRKNESEEMNSSNGNPVLEKKEAKKRYKEERERIKRAEKERKEQKKKEAKENKKRGKNFVGHEISGPTNFSHDTHVGWDMERGFEVRTIALPFLPLRPFDPR